MDELPKFEIDPGKINILESPTDFYDALRNGIQSSSRRIVLSSLYLGSKETELVKMIGISMRNNKNLKVTILLDYFRGSRLDKNQSSLSSLAPLKNEFGDRFTLAMYHSPKVGALMRYLVPPRFIEAFGLQHMKGYLFDDSLIISGANLNRDYFTNRQDRYISISSKLLPEYFSDLITNVCLFSYTLGPQSSLKPPKLVTQRECIVLMNEFIATWKSNTSDNAIFQEKAKTFLYPTLQMRSLNITQDETLLTNLFKSATFGDIIHIATSYFNLPVKYQNILWKSKARFEILTSAPEANGFFNSDGVSKYIPPAYSYLETKFLNRAYVAGKGKSVIVHEYSKPGWTWHGKGIWWQKKDGILITAIGSSNMNYRSLDRDLELQFYLQTSDSELKRRFHKNLSNLYHHTNIITLQALKKRKSSWILKLAAEAVKRFL